MKQERYEGWITVAKFGTDYEADILRDRLDDAGFSAVTLTQRDHAFNLMVGDLATVRVMVPPEQFDEAKAFIASDPSTDIELDEAAMTSNTDIPSSEIDPGKTLFDSGSEAIRFDVPQDDDEDEDKA